MKLSPSFFRFYTVRTTSDGEASGVRTFMGSSSRQLPMTLLVLHVQRARGVQTARCR